MIVSGAAPQLLQQQTSRILQFPCDYTRVPTQNTPTMSSTTREPNPLRPYYKPPSIGIPQDLPPPPNTTSAPPYKSGGATHGLGAKNGSAARYASSAREMFNDLDYADYLSENHPSSFESVQRQLNEWTSKYFGVLLAQPFDVAKTILQVRHQGSLESASANGSETGRSSSRSSYREESYTQVRVLIVLSKSPPC